MRGDILALTNGCLDILHRGHNGFHTGANECIAAQTGIDADRLRLVVTVNSEAGVRQIEGNDCPYNREADRRDVVGALEGCGLGRCVKPGADGICSALAADRYVV